MHRHASNIWAKWTPWGFIIFFVGPPDPGVNGLLTLIWYGAWWWFWYIRELSEATLTVSATSYYSDYLARLGPKLAAAANLSPIWYRTIYRIQHPMTRTYIAPIALTSHPSRWHRAHPAYRINFYWIWAKFCPRTPSDKHCTYIAHTSHLHHTYSHNSHTNSHNSHTLKNTIENCIFSHGFPARSGHFRSPHIGCHIGLMWEGH